MSNEQKTPHWIPCPICNKQTDVKVYSDTVLFNFPLHCPQCEKESIINVMNLKMTVNE